MGGERKSIRQAVTYLWPGLVASTAGKVISVRVFPCSCSQSDYDRSEGYNILSRTENPMPKRKKQPEVQPENANGATANGRAAGPAISKADAMRKALRELGRDAKNSDLAEFIRSRYGEDAVPRNLSVAKSVALKKLRQAARKKAAAPAGEKPAATPAPTPTGTITLDDVRQVKELTERLGKDGLKEMVDLLR
jgi:pyruvate/2-oxoglutarate dehydrogenase complex dihydrolipoamide acyltransferase (E2) component